MTCETTAVAFSVPSVYRKTNFKVGSIMTFPQHTL